MKQSYTIGEISHMLGIGIDAIRFYEKKGLVHPQKHPKTHYRSYTMHNILELLDVIYYRELDMSVSDITSIFQTGTKENLKALLEIKRVKAEQRIRYERQLIKKLTYIEDVYEMIERHEGILIKEVPETFILAKSNEKDEIMRSQISDLKKDQFVMSSLYSSYDTRSKERKDLYITMEQSVMEEFGFSLNRYEHLPLHHCVYTIVQMKQAMIQKEDIELVLSYANHHALSFMDTLYVHEIPLFLRRFSRRLPQHIVL